MKKIVAVSLAILALHSSQAFAAVNWTNDATHAAFTVDGNGSTTAKTNFGWDETPWLYVLLPGYSTDSPSLKANTTLLQDKWNFGDRTAVDGNANTSEAYGATQTVSGDKLDFWVSPTNWTTIRQAGSWEIYDIFYQFKNGANLRQEGAFTGNSGIVNFTVNGPTVTPEPVSMALFGIGAGALGLKRFRRKNNKV